MNELATKEISIKGGLVQLQSMTDALSFCDTVIRSQLCPSSFKTKEAVFLALQTGGELGLSPMQSLQGLYAFNGRVAMMENCARGIAHHSGKLESITDRFEGTGDDLTAICVIRRKGSANDFIGKFSVADAKRAGLWEKKNANGSPSPWILYPKDMLRKKASARALRDSFSDVLIGLPIKEDIEDLPPEKRESVNPTPVYDPLISAEPAPEIVDIQFSEVPSEDLSKIPERIADVEIPQPKAMREPGDDTEEIKRERVAGPKEIVGEIQWFGDSKSNPAKYYTIKINGLWFSGSKSIGDLIAAKRDFDAKKRPKYRAQYTEQTWERNGKSGVNLTIIGLEEI